MQRWKRLESRFVLDGRWLRVRADRCEIEPGRVVDPYYVVEECDWVHVYASTPSGDVLTVRQYRYAADAFCLELPGGVVDEGESPESAARRELLEETGHVAARWSYVTRMFANPARQTNALHVFLAEELQLEARQDLDDTESIAWSFMAPAALAAAVQGGEFSQALHVASLYRAQEFVRSRGAV